MKVILVFLLTFFLSGCSIIRTPSPDYINDNYIFTPYQNSDAFEKHSLIHKYAPILHQYTLDKSQSDFITDFDFDGDGKAETNRDNRFKKEMRASIYYSIVATKTHFFITYFLYHVEDRWVDGICMISSVLRFGGSHENDGESIQLVIERNTDGSAGEIIILASQHHNSTTFLIDKKIQPFNWKVQLSDTVKKEGLNPLFKLEPGKHAIHVRHNSYRYEDSFHHLCVNSENNYQSIEFSPNTNLKSPGDKWVEGGLKYKYGFKSIKTDLWDSYLKDKGTVLGNGGIMDGAFDLVLEKGLKIIKYKSLPRFFDGDKLSVFPIKFDAGIVPFYFGGGELFFDPAYYYKKKFHLYEKIYFKQMNWDTDYIYNPYLPDYFRVYD